MKMKLFLSALTAALLLCSCGEIDSSSSDSSDSTDVNASVADSSDAESIQTDSSQPEINVSSVTLDLAKKDLKQVKHVTLEGKLSKQTRLKNLYGVNVLHSEIVGLFGCPVEVVSDNFTGGTLTFEYDPENMRGVPEKNLVLLHYTEDNSYDEITASIDEENNQITAQITEAGDYMLVDAFLWIGAWGGDVTEYAHDTEFFCDMFGFSVTIPKEAAYRTALLGDVWSECGGGMEEKIIISANESDSNGITANITAMKYPDDLNKLAPSVEKLPVKDMVREMVDSLGSQGYKSSVIDTFDAGYDKTGYVIDYAFEPDKGCYSAFIEYNSDAYIVLSFATDDTSDTQMTEKVFKSIKSFRYSSEPEPETVNPTEKIPDDKNEDENVNGRFSEANGVISYKSEKASFEIKKPDGFKYRIPEGEERKSENNDALTYLLSFSNDYLYHGYITYSTDSVQYRADMKNLAKLYSDTNGLALVKSEKIKLSDSAEGLIVIGLREQQAGLGDENGVYDFYGIYPLGDGEFIYLTFILDRNVPEEIYDSVYESLLSFKASI